MKLFVIGILSILWLNAPAAISQNKTSANDSLAIRQAILDYVEGVYEADTTRIARGVHPELAKRGYYTQKGTVVEAKMTYAGLIRTAQVWSKHEKLPPNPPKVISIFDIQDKIATAKLVAYWGSDYFHLAKVNGKWQIYNVIWQD